MTDKNLSNAATFWDQRFSASDFLFGTAPNAYLASQRQLFDSGKSALAVADGEGRNSVWLAQQGLVVDAFDVSPVGVAKARKLAQQAGVTVNFNVCDCDAWNWRPASYDYVVAIFVQFADPAMRHRLFLNMVNALKPGGYLIVQGYTPQQLEFNTGGPGILAHLYTEQLLRDAFSALHISDMKLYEEVLSEGKQHSGRSALVGMVGRKAESI